ncbi:MAG: hypothetical protein QG626_713 [Patescibacteria group bacterium]|nr:hypothetical protein [Patescibacteria group bacterium]
MGVKLGKVALRANHVMILANIRKNAMFRKLLPILGLFPVFLSAFVIQTPWFGLFALLTYLGLIGYSLGPRLSHQSVRGLELGTGIMATVAAMSILGSLVYYTATVTTQSLFLVLLIIAIITSVLSAPSTTEKPHPHFILTDIILFGIGLASLCGWWIAVAQTQILEPVRSVWLIFSPINLVALGITLACAVTLLLREKMPLLGILLFGGWLFSALALAAQVYGLGYGFDPFLHRATIAHIATHGTITPKPLYYIGEYALELIGFKIFALPLFSLDAFLSPLLAAFGITTALLGRSSERKTSPTALLALLLLPLAAFVQTTPQALAFIFTAWTLFIPSRPLAAPFLFALAAVITHPLAGIGALIYVALLAFERIPKHWSTLKYASIGMTTLGASIAIPIAFTLQAKLAHLSLAFHPENLIKFWQLPISLFVGTHFNTWGDLAYTFIDNAFIIVLILALPGVWSARKAQSGWYVPGLVAAAMFVNFIIMSLGFDFTFLIAYERLDFALRLLTLTTLFLLPYVGITLSDITARLKNRPPGLRLGFVAFLVILSMSSVYGAYPRHDNYARSAGFNVGPSDISAVHAIEQNAAGAEYIVLSDQALAAAAVQEFGFKTYYHNDIFFYPIPTGGPLYQDFLTMVEVAPTLETVTSAMDLAGVDRAYFAIHSYWWQAPQIIENTKAIAGDWFAIGNGDVTVFIFERPNVPIPDAE